MAARLIQDAINEVRDILQDTDSANYRYSDASLARSLNNAFYEVKRLRPDMFVLGDEIPVFTSVQFDQSYPFFVVTFQVVVYFIAGNTELRDDEFALDGRAMTLIGAFKAALVGAKG